MPVSLVSLVFSGAQVVAGSSGLTGWVAETGGTPIEWSFCAHAVASGQPYVVPDAARDDVQGTNPAVTVDGVASYAGFPLVSASGHVLGAHCVVGVEPHEFTPKEVAVLERAAAEVVAALDRARRA
jgi:GAF domain-containing protein